MTDHARRARLRIQALATTLLRSDFTGAHGVWEFQMSLLSLQQDIQAAITEEKKKPRTKRDQDALDDLQDARWHARHLGDAFAWLLFKLDRQKILSLGNNSRVPVVQPGHGYQGMISIATALANNGWGFPLLHDISDCLRIGDITFIRPDQEPSYVTVEVKTRLLSEAPNDDGSKTLRYETKVLSQYQMDIESGGVVGEVDLSLKPPEPPRERIDRQAERMRTALLRARASDGMIDGLDEPTLSLNVSLGTKSHWDVLKRLIREAHTSCYAGAAVDKAAFYSVFYRKGGIEVETVQDPRFLDDLTKSDFMHSSDPEERALIIYAVPHPREDQPYETLPYFLFPLPRRAIFEILSHELMIMVHINPGHVCDRLRSEGFDIEARPQQSGPSEIVVIDTFTSDSGRPLRTEAHIVAHVLRQSVGEFHSLDFLVGMTRHMVEASREHARTGALQKLPSSQGPAATQMSPLRAIPIT